ncbi:hypothetical protein CPB86DRAFT_283461 [Serendipita vermifera]|nr:hypothetical protein CPB86DRAFT_283461 [Serendipita vermifera]
MYTEKSSESSVQRAPIEVWELILQAATQSTLFPFIDIGNEKILGGSIIQNIHLFGQTCHPFSLYAQHQQTVNRLRRVCSVWNHLLKQISARQRWALTNLFNDYYPSFDGDHPPLRLCIDDGYRNHFCREATQTCLKQIWKQKWNENRDTASDIDSIVYIRRSIAVLAQIKVAILDSFTTEPDQLLDLMHSIQALSLDVYATCSTLNLSKLDLGPSIRRLTHLQLHHLDGAMCALCNDSVLDLSNLIYLSIRLWNIYDPLGMHGPLTFDKWKLARLQSLSIGGKISMNVLEGMIPFFIRCGETATELLLDVTSPWETWKSRPWETWGNNKLFRNLWDYLPHLSVLGCEIELLGALTFSILYRNSADSKPLSLFILPNEDVHHVVHSSEPKLLFTYMWQAFEGGNLGRVYFAESPHLFLSPRPFHRKSTEGSLLGGFINYCLRYGIPIYGIDGWQFCSNKRVPWM